MEAKEYFFVIFGILLIAAGLASIITNKVYLAGKSLSKYTDESLEKWARPYGFTMLCEGLAFLMYKPLDTEQFQIGGSTVTVGFIFFWGFTVIALIIFLRSHKYLVKK